MKWLLESEEGVEQMRRRKFKVEPVFGITKSAIGFRRLSMRGLDKARCEWTLICTVYNLRKLFGATTQA